ncbi:unnamed protein product, partial [Schistosoma haematobium]
MTKRQRRVSLSFRVLTVPFSWTAHRRLSTVIQSKRASSAQGIHAMPKTARQCGAAQRLLETQSMNPDASLS